MKIIAGQLIAPCPLCKEEIGHYDGKDGWNYFYCWYCKYEFKIYHRELEQTTLF